MATASRDLGSITAVRPSTDIIREAFHDSLRDYVRAVLGCGQQTAESEKLVASAFESILRSGSSSDISWAQHRLGRAISALDDGDYATVHLHQLNFQKMIQALGIQKTVCSAISNLWER